MSHKYLRVGKYRLLIWRSGPGLAWLKIELESPSDHYFHLQNTLLLLTNKLIDHRIPGLFRILTVFKSSRADKHMLLFYVIETL